MNDHDGKRQAPSETRIELPRHGQPGVGAKEDFGKPCTMSKSHVRRRQKGAISPPPLKRQRTTYVEFSSETHDPRSTNRQAHLPARFSALRHSSSGPTEAAPTAQSKRKPEVILVSKSFSGPFAPHQHDSGNTHHTSGSRHLPRPRQSSKPATLSKPVCRICEKNSATSFNPIVSCSGCSRSCHDSCRKPPLAPGTDPQRWRCSSCLSDNRTRTKAKLSSALPLTGRSVVRDIFKPIFAPSAPDVVPLDCLPKTNSDAYVKPEPARLTTSATTSIKPTELKKASGPPQPPEPKPLERVEIPNTPSQRSSQIENSTPGKSSRNFAGTHVFQQYHHVPGVIDALAMEVSTKVQNHTPSTTLCLTCQKQTVLVRSEERGIQCSGCHIRTCVAKTGKLEIPETPNVDSSHNAPPLPKSSANSVAHCSVAKLDDHELAMVSSTQELPMSEAKPDSAMVKASSLSWFDSERAKTLPTIGKVRDAELTCMPTANIQASDAATTSHEAFLGQNTPMEVDSIADASEQKTALNAKQVLQGGPVYDNAIVPQVDTQREKCIPPAGILNHDELSRISELHGTHSVSYSKSDIPGESGCSRPATAVPKPNGLILDVLPNRSSAERTTDQVTPMSYTEEQAPAVLESKGTTENVRSPSDPNVFVSPTLARTGSLEANKCFNSHDLARIALVCAKGTGLTALQAIDWLASRFSHLHKGQGAWEKTLRSALSVLPDIRGVKAPHQPVVYSFASAAFRAENEKRYQSYLPPVSVLGPQGGKPKARKSVRQQHGADTLGRHGDVQSEPSTQIKRSVTKAIKSAPNRRTVPPHSPLPPSTVLEQTLSHKPGPAAVAEPAEIDTSAANPDGEKIPSIPPSPSVSGPNLQDAETSKAKITLEDNAMFNPFERPTAPRPKVALSPDVETTCKTSFRSVYPRTTAPSIEIMTSEEKAAKITEIKMRPKRKQFFGSIYRLAHVRRYGRQDIHDESDGAWKPNSTIERPTGEQDSIMKDCDENRSLLEVFNLPSNAIPMNDGKELAFRDGTLINGRLPRPRQIYRVGKVFGGELTIS